MFAYTVLTVPFVPKPLAQRLATHAVTRLMTNNPSADVLVVNAPAFVRHIERCARQLESPSVRATFREHLVHPDTTDWEAEMLRNLNSTTTVELLLNGDTPLTRNDKRTLERYRRAQRDWNTCWSEGIRRAENRKGAV